MGPPVKEGLAEPLTEMLSIRMDTKKGGQLHELLLRPANMPLLQPARVNPAIWSELPQNTRSLDVKLQKITEHVTRSMTLLTKVAENMEAMIPKIPKGNRAELKGLTK